MPYISVFNVVDIDFQLRHFKHQSTSLSTFLATAYRKKIIEQFESLLSAANYVKKF